jgi:hypothetical protein
VSLHTEAAAPDPKLEAAVAGTVTVNQDERSGSIEATLSDHSHIKGTWACM